ncbi:unnamed protein product [Lathyrus sativus]|nr:unnamed protein product [Lathyrus sativus]
MSSPDEMLENRLREISRPVDIYHYSRPKIQKVANNLRERTDYKSHYLPKIVSMGPIHHGIPELQIGEHYKFIWAKHYIESTGLSSKDLYQTIADNFAELKDDYADNVFTMARNTDPKSFGSFDEKLAWMLFVDGCSLLYILDTDNHFDNKETIMKLVSRDVLLLENQLPFKVLRLLSGDRFNLIERVQQFLEFNHIAKIGDQAECPSDIETTHLLDLLRQTLFLWSLRQIRIVRAAYLFMMAGSGNSLVTDLAHNSERPKNSIISNSVIRYMNIQELKSNGIKIKSSKSSRIDMSFSHRWLNGELKLPEIVLDDITVSIFLNLIAYEMSPDFNNDYGFSTFLVFINSLIRQPEDVKDLRLAGILFSNYGTDEELIKLFHYITTDAVSNAKPYSDLFEKINKHMTNKWKTKTVRFLRYIRHPWTNFAVHSAELALAFTVIQTWFAVHPAKS